MKRTLSAFAALCILLSACSARPVEPAVPPQDSSAPFSSAQESSEPSPDSLPSSSASSAPASSHASSEASSSDSSASPVSSASSASSDSTDSTESSAQASQDARSASEAADSSRPGTGEAPPEESAVSADETAFRAEESAASGTVTARPASDEEVPPTSAFLAADSSSEEESGQTASASSEALSDVRTRKASGYNVSGKQFLTDVEDEFVRILNRKREDMGLAILGRDDDLDLGSRLRATELVQTGTFAHARPDGRSWHTVLEEEYPVDFRVTGENLASAGYAGHEELVHQTARQWYDQWEQSPEHYENMFREEYQYIGVGIYYSFQDGEYSSVACTLFGAD